MQKRKRVQLGTPFAPRATWDLGTTVGVGRWTRANGGTHNRVVSPVPRTVAGRTGGNAAAGSPHAPTTPPSSHGYRLVTPHQWSSYARAGCCSPRQVGPPWNTEELQPPHRRAFDSVWAAAARCRTRTPRRGGCGHVTGDGGRWARRVAAPASTVGWHGTRLAVDDSTCGCRRGRGPPPTATGRGGRCPRWRVAASAARVRARARASQRRTRHVRGYGACHARLLRDRGADDKSDAGPGRWGGGQGRRTVAALTPPSTGVATPAMYQPAS